MNSMLTSPCLDVIGRFAGALFFASFGYLLGLAIGALFISVPLKVAGKISRYSYPEKMSLWECGLFAGPYVSYAVLLTISGLNKSFANVSLVESGLIGLVSGASYMLTFIFFPKSRSIQLLFMAVLCLLAYVVWEFMPFITE